jgi:hypothetical protein
VCDPEQVRAAFRQEVRVIARLRLGVPDRPGSLGQVAAAIGVGGADIVKIDVLESEGGRALDDVFVDVRSAEHLDQVRTSLLGVVGVQVAGCQLSAPPVTGHADLELLRQVLADPERGLRTLVDGAPHAFGADWAALVEYGPDGGARTLAVSARGPEPEQVRLTSPLRLAAVRLSAPGAAEPYAGAAVIPVGAGPVALVLVRPEGPDFHTSELWRVGQVGEIVGALLARSDTVRPA